MATTKKRIQVLLPVKAQAIIERIADEEEVSQSRVVSTLVTEALAARGELGNWQVRTPDQVAQELGVDVQTIAPTKAGNKPIDQFWEVTQKAREEAEEQEQPSTAIDDDDLKLLKKLKLLKELGLL